MTETLFAATFTLSGEFLAEIVHRAEEAARIAAREELAAHAPPPAPLAIYMTIAEAAKRYGVSRRTVHAWLESHGMPVARIGDGSSFVDKTGRTRKGPTIVRIRVESADAWFASGGAK